MGMMAGIPVTSNILLISSMGLSRTIFPPRAESDLARGIVRGNLLAYAGHESGRVADMVIRAFAEVPEGSMEGVRVLFIGDAADRERVEQAVAPAGVEFVFIEK